MIHRYSCPTYSGTPSSYSVTHVDLKRSLVINSHYQELKLSIIDNRTNIFAIRPDMQHQWGIHFQLERTVQKYSQSDQTYNTSEAYINNYREQYKNSRNPTRHATPVKHKLSIIDKITKYWQSNQTCVTREA